MHATADGQVRVHFKKPNKAGATYAQMSPDTAVHSRPTPARARLCALVPPPGNHLILYYGVLAARHSLRSRIVPNADTNASEPKQLALFVPRGQLELVAITKSVLDNQLRDAAPRRLSWMKLLARVFDIDISVCRRCQLEVADAPVSLDVAVNEGLPISGTVVDARGDPIARALVLAKGPRSHLRYTGSEGRFTLHGLAPGLYELRASRRGLRPSEAVEVEVAPATAPNDVELRLSPGASIRIEVTADSGDPVADVCVAARPTEGGESLSCCTVNDGTCMVRGLFAGRYDVDVADMLGADEAPGCGSAPSRARPPRRDWSAPHLRR